MSEIERQKSEKNENEIAQKKDKANDNKSQNYQNLRIKIEQNDDEMINLNKTEESLFNEKNDSECIYNKNKNKNYQINNSEKDIKEMTNKKNILKPEEKGMDATDDKKLKKVKFMEPQFVKVIYVESYKKFNQENTSREPYYNANNQTDKTNLICSCFII